MGTYSGPSLYMVRKIRDSPADAPRSLGEFHWSNTVTSYPRLASCQAVMVPMMPAPMTAIFSALAVINLADLQSHIARVDVELGDLDERVINEVSGALLADDRFRGRNL